MCDIKKKVRQSTAWKEFRENLIREQKVDPITGKKLTKGCNCHHRDLNIEHYAMLSNERQVMLNRQSHTLIHMIYGDERRRKDWRTIVKNIIEQCEWMDRFNA